MKKLFYIILIIFISYWTYYYFFKSSSSKTAPTLTYETVSTWTIKESIDVVGKSELVDEQSLRFNQLWTVVKVNFKDWDKVKKWDIIAELDKANWETSIKEAQLNLDNVNIALKELYKKADESKILQAQNNVSISQKSLEISNSELENLKITQSNSLNDLNKSIDISKKELENLKTTQENWLNDLLKNIENSKKELENSKSSLNLSKSDLEVTKSKLDNDLSNSISDKKNTISQIETSFLIEKTNIWKIIDEVDSIIWLTSKNSSLNDDYESYLWAKNSWLKNQALNSLWETISLYNNLSSQISSYNNNSDIESMKSILKSILSTYNSLEKATDYTYQTIDNSFTSTTFTESDISSMKSIVYTYKTNVQSKIWTINNYINTLNTLTDIDLLTKTNSNNILSQEDSLNSINLAITKKENDLKSLVNSYETTKKSYELTYKNKEKELQTLQDTYITTKTKNEIELNTKIQSIENIKKTLEVNNQTLKEVLEWPTSENVEKAKNNITQAEIKLQNAKDSLEDYELISPFEWIVRKIDYKVWDKLLSDSDKYVYIENPNLVQIPVSLDQVDIVKVSVWKKATIIFDAYPTIKVEWIINSIDYTPIETSWVVTYTAYLIITDKNFDKKILSWMTADIEIIIEQKENILILPTTSITTQDDKYYVNLNKNWKIIKTKIEVWLSSWWQIEIISWLEVWDKVSVTSFSWTTSKSTWTSLFSLPSWNNRNRTSWSSNTSGPPWGF